MKKFLKVFGIAAFVAIAGIALSACGGKKEEEPAEIVGVKTEAEFLETFEVESVVKLGADITLAEKIDINKDIEIDLNNHKLTFGGDNQYLIYVATGKTVTIKNGRIEHASTELIEVIKSYITNRGTLTLKNINLQITDVDAIGPDNVNAVGNWGEGVLTIENSTISMTTKADTTNNFKPTGLWNMGRTFNFTNSTLNVVGTTTGSMYGVYDYIDDSESDTGTRTLNITGSTINATSTVVNSLSGVFAESYLSGTDNKTIINIGANTVVNVTRSAETGSGKKTYALRAKGNATITGADNATLTITDATECQQIERGVESNEGGTGVIED